jgi:putative hemolysin
MFEASRNYETAKPLSRQKESVLQKVIRKVIDKKIENYTPFHEIFSENSRYIVKTVSDGEELRKILELRHTVYYKELLNTEHFLKLDVDKFDFRCDHLAVIDRKSGQFVGTYRLNSSLFNDKFYSSTEFHLDKIEQLEGVKLEIGRACVHPDFRNAITISMLWKGMLEYMMKTETRWLFGCSSIKTTDPLEAALLYKHFHKEGSKMFPDIVRPKKNHKISGFDQYLEKYIFNDPESEKANNIEKLVPPLLNFYIKAGAKICGEPAVDWDFKCIDFLTLLDVSTVSERLHRKFG